MLSCHCALEREECDSAEANVRAKILLWAEPVVRISKQRLLIRVMTKKLEGGSTHPRGHKNKWSACFRDDLKAFAIGGDWIAMAQDAATWNYIVTKGKSVFMGEWRRKEDIATRVRHARAEERNASKTTVVP